MADISKCVYKNCSKSNTCYRFLAPEGRWQSYMHFEDICGAWNDFLWYWEVDIY